MIDQMQTFVEQFTARAQPIEQDLSVAWWQAATTASPESQAQIERLTRQYMELFSVPDDWEQIQTWYTQRAAIVPDLLRRQITVLYLAYASNQRSADDIAQIAALEADLSSTFTTFRSTIDGTPVSDNDILTVLQTTSDGETAREAWEASKQIGPVVAERLRELARVRNRGAHALGYSDYHAQQLALQEIDEATLLAIFDHLEAATREPFRARKAEIDAHLAARYGIAADDVRPWHYADPFFQEAPKLGTIDLDAVYADQDVVELALRSFDAQGFDVRDVLSRSDLYERAGKNQHAFCAHVGRMTADVRVLCNLQPTTRWMDTLLHELGHAVYFTGLAPDLPFLLREPAHTTTTEAIAMLMGRQARRADWLERVRGLAPDEAQHYAAAACAEQQLGMLVFVRWALVMLHFERALYADPDRADLNTLWWDLVERFQMLRRPDDRDAPDWAAKIHLAIAPVYYHNYVLGELIASQVEQYIEQRSAESFVANPQTGSILHDELFALGGRMPWDETVQHVTGEALTARYFVEQFVETTRTGATQ